MLKVQTSIKLSEASDNEPASCPEINYSSSEEESEDAPRQVYRFIPDSLFSGCIVEEELLNCFWRGSFNTKKDIIAHVTKEMIPAFEEDVEDPENSIDDIEEYVNGIVVGEFDEALKKFLTWQGTWAKCTDYDILDSIFEELAELHQIVCIHDIDSSNGPDGIRKRVKQEVDKFMELYDEKPIGACFYTDKAVDGVIHEKIGLHLNFISLDGKQQTKKKVGYSIVEVMDEHNVPFIWDGSTTCDINISIMWHKRLHLKDL